MKRSVIRIALGIFLTILLLTTLFFPGGAVDENSDSDKNIISRQMLVTSSELVPIEMEQPTGFTNHSPIRINNNSGFNVSNGVKSGIGTPEDPFIIADWEIDGTSNGSCIYFGNTTAHFIVRNCSLHNASGNSNTYHWNSAITLYNVQNGVVFNNSVYNNDRNGLFLISSTNVIIENNTFYANNVNNIFCSYSNNNIFKNNNCTTSFRNVQGILLYYSINI